MHLILRDLTSGYKSQDWLLAFSLLGLHNSLGKGVNLGYLLEVRPEAYAPSFHTFDPGDN